MGGGGGGGGGGGLGGGVYLKKGPVFWSTVNENVRKVSEESIRSIPGKFRNVNINRLMFPKKGLVQFQRDFRKNRFSTRQSSETCVQNVFRVSEGGMKIRPNSVL